MPPLKKNFTMTKKNMNATNNLSRAMEDNEVYKMLINIKLFPLFFLSSLNENV